MACRVGISIYSSDGRSGAIISHRYKIGPVWNCGARNTIEVQGHGPVQEIEMRTQIKYTRMRHTAVSLSRCLSSSRQQRARHTAHTSSPPLELAHTRLQSLCSTAGHASARASRPLTHRVQDHASERVTISRVSLEVTRSLRRSSCACIRACRSGVWRRHVLKTPARRAATCGLRPSKSMI